ncbi:PREDICTED: interleukin-8-like [Thamnophis sirtalis]|uniref:Interleukin-8-like n=1 Tax=Thamnophis sirtalis TaxID=35019 RepID=A0A6I9YHK0_9SAUR|nr:PREDICTED: interleukin-8-like [Thamnophis sirtalis]
MDFKAATAFLALLLVSATLTEGASLSRVGLELRCQCIETYSNPSLRGHIASVNLIKSGPHCSSIQVIATLKDGRQVCLDPTALWVKRVITNLLEKCTYML